MRGAVVLDLQAKIVKALSATPQTAEQIAKAIGADSAETVYLVLEHLSANGRAQIAQVNAPGANSFSARGNR